MTEAWPRMAAHGRTKRLRRSARLPSLSPEARFTSLIYRRAEAVRDDDRPGNALKRHLGNRFL